jgi:hypothetical protein
MGRRDDRDADDYIQQALERGDRSRSEREPTRTCSNCTGGKVTSLESDGVNAKGQPKYKNVARNCDSCGGRGVR